MMYRPSCSQVRAGNCELHTTRVRRSQLYTFQFDKHCLISGKHWSLKTPDTQINGSESSHGRPMLIQVVHHSRIRDEKL